MKNLQEFYGAFSAGLLTDLYELTMAYGYWKRGLADTQAVFTVTFRQNPFNGGYAVFCGLEQAIQFLTSFRYTPEDTAYLATLTGNDERPLFEQAFLDYLCEMKFECDVDAVKEGTIIFPQEPIVRVRGPIIQAQIIETALLAILNFQSLIATKAARVVQAAEGDAILEFGLRRAQGLDGGVSASRAAYIGGVAATSNALAGKMFGIPVKGTHAHSWVMLFESELDAFLAYGEAMPHNCVYLVDTYNSLQGVENAVAAARKLREKGMTLSGIRLDSGDLAYLSIKAREMLDAAGFPDAAIVASNDLDEEIIASLRQQKAQINVWGVGTRLVTAYDQPSLGGVYKLTAIKSPDKEWANRIKLSEQLIKVTNPGIPQVRRYFDENGNAVGDMIFDIRSCLKDTTKMIDPFDPTRRKSFSHTTAYEDLLCPVFAQGTLVYELPNIEQIRSHLQNQLRHFHSGVKRFVNPHRYPVGLEKSYYDTKINLIMSLRHTE